MGSKRWADGWFKKKATTTGFGLGILLTLSVLQVAGLLWVSHQLPTGGRTDIYPAGVEVTNWAVAILTSVALLSMTCCVLYCVSSRYKTSWWSTSILLFLGYVATPAILVATSSGVEYVCSERPCVSVYPLVGELQYSHYFLFVTIAQGVLLSVTSALWSHPVIPDLPTTNPQIIDTHLQKWWRVTQILISLGIATSFAFSIQFFLQTRVSGFFLFVLLLVVSPSVILIGLFPVFKLHYVSELKIRALQVQN